MSLHRRWLKSSRRRALCAALLVAASCASLGVAAAQTPPADADQAAPSPLPVLARHSVGAGETSRELAWSPNGLHVALTNVEADDKRWVMIYGVLPSSAPLKVQEYDSGTYQDPTQTLWLDATHLAVFNDKEQRVWEVTADGVKPADTAPLKALTPELIARAHNSQCLRYDPTHGLNVISHQTDQGLRWSHPMQPREVQLGSITNYDEPLLPCVSPDGGAVALTMHNKDKDNYDDADLVIMSLTGQATAATDPAPALWGPWTQAQLLQAISPEGALNMPNITLQTLPWPGRADAVAVFTYGHAQGQPASIHASILIDKDGALVRAATTSLASTTSDKLSVTVGLSPERFHDTESTLRVTQTLSTDTNTGFSNSQIWSYLRWHDDKLDVILSFEHTSSSSSCEGGDNETQTLTILKPARDGFHDLSLASTKTEEDYDPDLTSKPVKTKQTWRWDGTQYQPVK
jgi:hypothetical protein